MKWMLCLFLTTTIFSLAENAHAQTGAVTDGKTCVKAEGLALPLCMFPKYHFCHFPPPGECKYVKVQPKVITYADPKIGPCAQGGMTCTTITEGPPEAPVIRQSCVCNHYEPNYTECRKRCGFCKVDEQVFIPQIKCGGPAGCDPPERCKTPLIINGETWVKKSNDSLPSCQEAPPQCDILVGPAPPPDEQCPQPPTRDWHEDCCYYGPAGGNQFGLPVCPPD